MFESIKGFLGGSVAGVVDSVFNGIDKIDNKDLRLEIGGQLQMMLLSIQSKVVEAQSAIIQLEAKGNWLQRSWRPVLALAFGFIVVYAKFIAPAFSLPNTELDENFWTLLQIMIGGYTTMRSVEKIAPSIAEILKKK